MSTPSGRPPPALSASSVARRRTPSATTPRRSTPPSPPSTPPPTPCATTSACHQTDCLLSGLTEVCELSEARAVDQLDIHTRGEVDRLRAEGPRGEDQATVGSIDLDRGQEPLHDR